MNEGSKFLSFCPCVCVDLNFFTRHKAALETRLPMIRPLLIKLEDWRILSSMEREMVEVEKTSFAQNHVLISLLSKKGKGAQEKFYQILKETDPFFVGDLEGKWVTKHIMLEQNSLVYVC